MTALLLALSLTGYSDLRRDQLANLLNTDPAAVYRYQPRVFEPEWRLWVFKL